MTIINLPVHPEQFTGETYGFFLFLSERFDSSDDFGICDGVWFSQSKVPNFLSQLTTVLRAWMPYLRQAPVVESSPNSISFRSEERRVGKECRSRWVRYQ